MSGPEMKRKRTLSSDVDEPSRKRLTKEEENEKKKEENVEKEEEKEEKKEKNVEKEEEKEEKKEEKVVKKEEKEEKKDEVKEGEKEGKEEKKEEKEDAKEAQGDKENEEANGEKEKGDAIKTEDKKQDQQDKQDTAPPPIFKKEGKDLMENIFRLRSARNPASSTACPTLLASSSSPSSSLSSAPSLPDSSTLPTLPSTPFPSSSESPFLLASKKKEESEKERNPKKRAGEALDEGRRGEKKVKKSSGVVTFSCKKKGDIEERFKSNANTAVQFSLVNYKRKEETIKFHPEFTHQVFEEDETILGFHCPSIMITFACDSFDVNIETSWEDKLPGVSPLSLSQKIEEYLPKDKQMAPSLSVFFENLVKERTEKKWKPPGEKIFEYETPLPFCDVPSQELMKIGVWKATFSDSAARNIFNQLQVLSIFFIDGASLLDITDYTWVVYFLYGFDSHTDSYCLMGFSTVYPFWNPKDLIRPRISQFLILPPFQGKGHGVRMLKCIYGDLLSSLTISDITVEDPSPSFQSMRDRVDVERCLSLGFLKDDQELTPDLIKTIQEKTKLPKMQILRCHEIISLWKIGLFANSELLKPLRLEMKKRYYRENKEALNVGGVDDRKRELDEFFTEAMAHYRRVGESLVKAGVLLPPPSPTPLLTA